MTARNYSNTASPVALTVAATSGATTLTVASTTGYPAAPFTLGLERGTANEEVCLCTALTSTVFTVTRGYDGTSAKAHAIGTSVEHTVASIDYTEANNHVNTPHVTSVAGRTGTVTLTAADIGAGTTPGNFNSGGTLSEAGVRVYSPSNPPPGGAEVISSPTTNYTVAGTDTVVLASNTITVTLPTAASSTGRKIFVKNIGTGTVTVATAGGNIDGAATAVISKQYNAITVVSDGTNWWII